MTNSVTRIDKKRHNMTSLIIATKQHPNKIKHLVAGTAYAY